MLATLRQHGALRILVVRAVPMFVLLRIVVTVVKADNPVGIVLLMTVLGAADIHFRREHIFWANLGYDRWLTWSIFGAVAFVGEVLLAVVIHAISR